MRLDLHLPPELVLHARFLQLLLKKYLQGKDELGLSLSGQIHAPELALAEGPADVKVLQTPRLPTAQGERGLLTFDTQCLAEILYFEQLQPESDSR